MLFKQAKHPPTPGDLSVPPEPDGTTIAGLVFEQEVAAALGSFDTGSSAGLDGLRPAHIKDMTSHSAGKAGVRLIEHLPS